MAAETEPMVVSPYVIAEVDCLVVTRLGVDAELAVLDELAGGAYHLAPFSSDDIAQSRELIDRYRDQAIGIAECWPDGTGPDRS